MIEGFFVGSIVGTFSYWVANPNVQEILVGKVPQVTRDDAVKFNRNEPVLGLTLFPWVKRTVWADAHPGVSGLFLRGPVQKSPGQTSVATYAAVGLITKGKQHG